MDTGFFGKNLFIKFIFCKVHNCTAKVINVSPTRKSNICYYKKYFDHKRFKANTYGLVYTWNNTESSFVDNNFESYKMYSFLIGLLLRLKALIRILKCDERTWGILDVFSSIILRTTMNIRRKSFLYFPNVTFVLCFSRPLGFSYN